MQLYTNIWQNLLDFHYIMLHIILLSNFNTLLKTHCRQRYAMFYLITIRLMHTQKKKKISTKL